MIVVALLALAGCGGQDREGPQPRHPAPAPKPGARGVMLVFPGGGWYPQPAEALRKTDHYIERYRKLGWFAENIAYRPGGEAGFEDALHAYDTARRTYPGRPVCAVGESSGGHLALMLAARRPLACVEGVGAPTDLRALKGHARKIAIRAFGDDLAAWSPVLMRDRIEGRIMLVQAENDGVLDPRQAGLMEGVEPLMLPPGDLAFMHVTRIDRDAYRRYLQAERRMLRAVER